MSNKHQCLISHSLNQIIQQTVDSMKNNGKVGFMYIAMYSLYFSVNWNYLIV